MDEGTVDDIRAARQELDQVIDEIRRVPGYEDFLAAPTFDDVARVADEQPLIYIAPADLGGLGLVVRGSDVIHVRLDGLTAEAVGQRVDSYLEASKAFKATERTAPWRAAIDDITTWLWTEAMGPVIAAVRPATAAVLVPCGLLGLLPLQAAWTEDATMPTGRRYALDDLVLSFVPNARSLASARALAARPVQRIVTVVDARLRAAPSESDVAAASFPSASNFVGDVDIGSLADAMRTADVVHFACHGTATVDVPLESSLEFGAARTLTLNEILTLNLRLRLAVLSGCETSIPGTDLPDEVVALPTGLLQAGVGGILASMWLVDDVAALIIMIEFYRRWRWEKLDAPTALRQSQQWLRDSSNGAIVRTYTDAASAGAPWLPLTAANAVRLRLQPLPLGEREFGGCDAWAAFAYFGA